MLPTTRQYGVLQEDVELESPTNNFSPFPGQPWQSSPITTKQKLYLLGMQGLGAGLVNVAINGLVAYLMYRTQPNNTVAFAGGMTCIVSDIVVSAFLIPCLTGIIGTILVRNDLRIGKLITPIDRQHLVHPLFKLIPTGQSWADVLKRSIFFGFIGAVAFAPITLVIIFLCTGHQGMQAVWTYVIFKGYWSGIEAMLFSPILAFIAITQQEQSSDTVEYRVADSEGTDLEDHEAGAEGDDKDHVSSSNSSPVTSAANYVVT